MTNDRPYVLDDQIGYLMRLATQRHTSIFQDRMDEGLTPTQFSLMTRLAEVGPSSQNHLGRLAALDVATVKGVVDRLAAKGLVVVAPDPSDGRLRIVSLSSRGAALLPQLQARGHEITEETMKPLTARERETIVRLLRKLA
ncbi:MarR family transcriptional regulator [Acuticoccus sediminis]|uniref:MarR family transcriptional regulator n=1 Tax=Acuticoccus sediminis TaxID=2184697 RepID=A0A8B2NS65_9HYPH|nr:MarR family transcriptional regulator [Acuticoccus sediminis]RAH99973.1 MarR family transcriptional regulator [Acuticoccus sediminis]